MVPARQPIGDKRPAVFAFSSAFHGYNEPLPAPVFVPAEEASLEVSMTSLYANLEKGRPFILSVLRIVVALLFLEHGLQKYFDFPSAGPQMTPLVYVQGAIETVGGILLL